MVFASLLFDLEAFEVLLRLQGCLCLFSLFRTILLVRDRIAGRYWPRWVAYVDVEIDVDVHVRYEDVAYAIFGWD